MAAKKKAKKLSKYVDLKLTRNEARRLRDVLGVVHITSTGLITGGKEESVLVAETEMPYPSSIDWHVWYKLEKMNL